MAKKKLILTAEMLILAYSQGMFPMANRRGIISWYDPDPRAIIPLEDFYVSKRLKRTMRKKPYQITVNHAFEEVIRACAEPYPGRESTWINEEIIQAYIELHGMGYAHSVEAWDGEYLVGGLYGVSINGLFAGESMFSLATDASKICLVSLVDVMKKHGLTLLDSQIINDHMAQFGVVEISRDEYHEKLQGALHTLITPICKTTL